MKNTKAEQAVNAQCKVLAGLYEPLIDQLVKNNVEANCATRPFISVI